MGRTLKTILWTVVVFAVIFLIAKAFFMILPVLLVAFAGIYIYGKLKNKFGANKSNTTSYSETYAKETAYTSEEDVVTEVVDVDFEDVEK
ncbi:MAG: hypothetical protein RR620_03095 [Clostridium sp.]